MVQDQKGKFPDSDAELEVRFSDLAIFERDDVRYVPRHAFRGSLGAAGLLFDMQRVSDDACLGDAVAVVSNDPALIGEFGHIGCDIRPEYRQQGYSTKLILALVPILRDRGVGDIMIACDVGHQSVYESCQEAGFTLLGENFGSAPPKCGARFLLRAPVAVPAPHDETGAVAGMHEEKSCP